MMKKEKNGGIYLKEAFNKENISRLAHLINQKYMNIHLYRNKKIPTYMFEQVDKLLCQKIYELEQRYDA